MLVDCEGLRESLRKGDRLAFGRRGAVAENTVAVELALGADGTEATELEGARAQAWGGRHERVEHVPRHGGAVGAHAVDGVGHHDVHERRGGGKGDPVEPAIVLVRKGWGARREEGNSDDAVDGLHQVARSWYSLKGRDEQRGGRREERRNRKEGEDVPGDDEGGSPRVGGAGGVAEEAIRHRRREEADRALRRDDNGNDQSSDEGSSYRGHSKVHDRPLRRYNVPKHG